MIVTSDWSETSMLRVQPHAGGQSSEGDAVVTEEELRVRCTQLSK